MNTGQDLDQRTLACAILSGQDMNLTRAQLQMHITQNGDLPKCFGDPLDSQKMMFRINSR